MKALLATFFRGLTVVLPVVLTGWLVVWLATSAERLLGSVFLWFLPQELYVPGLGVLLGVAFVFAIGLLVQVFLLRQFWAWMEGVFGRIPGVKTIYNAIRDFLEFFSNTGIDEDAARVVTIDMGNDVSFIGLVTDTDPEFPVSAGSDLMGR